MRKLNFFLSFLLPVVITLYAARGRIEIDFDNWIFWSENRRFTLSAGAWSKAQRMWSGCSFFFCFLVSSPHFWPLFLLNICFIPREIFPLKYKRVSANPRAEPWEGWTLTQVSQEEKRISGTSHQEGGLSSSDDPGNVSAWVLHHLWNNL